MLFYSNVRTNLKSFYSLFHKKKNYFRKKYKKTSKYLIKKPALQLKRYVIKFSNNWKFVILQTKINTKIIYFYSNVYYFKLPLLSMKSLIHVDLNSSSLLVYTQYIYTYYRVFWSTIQLIFTALSVPFFKKIKFKGKGYYIYKNKRKTITPQFGHAHRLYVYSFFVNVVFLSKTKILVFGLTKNDVLFVGSSIKKMRPINIFTGRGVRFSRQIIYRKTGKVSSYR